MRTLDAYFMTTHIMYRFDKIITMGCLGEGGREGAEAERKEETRQKPHSRNIFQYNTKRKTIKSPDSFENVMKISIRCSLVSSRIGMTFPKQTAAK